MAKLSLLIMILFQKAIIREDIKKKNNTNKAHQVIIEVEEAINKPEVVNKSTNINNLFIKEVEEAARKLIIHNNQRITTQSKMKRKKVKIGLMIGATKIIHTLEVNEVTGQTETIITGEGEGTTHIIFSSQITTEKIFNIHSKLTTITHNNGVGSRTNSSGHQRMANKKLIITIKIKECIKSLKRTRIL